MVEVAHNDNLTIFKKFVIIYIQVKELSDIVPHTKGSYSKLRLEEQSNARTFPFHGKIAGWIPASLVKA